MKSVLYVLRRHWQHRKAKASALVVFYAACLVGIVFLIWTGIGDRAFASLCALVFSLIILGIGFVGVGIIWEGQ